ncbi:hypothetical protein PT141_04710, partial (plasmid) [Borreliella garinii]
MEQCKRTFKRIYRRISISNLKKYDNDNNSKKHFQVWGAANYRDINQANYFAKRARAKAEHPITNLENASNAIAEGLLTSKEAKKLLYDIAEGLLTS